jgi:hypothetical protein
LPQQHPQRIGVLVYLTYIVSYTKRAVYLLSPLYYRFGTTNSLSPDPGAEESGSMGFDPTRTKVNGAFSERIFTRFTPSN